VLAQPQDWEVKIANLVRPQLLPQATAGTARDAVQDAKDLHYHWAEALAIASTHYARYNKHDNEFSPARIELLRLAQQYTVQYLAISAKVLQLKTAAESKASLHSSDGDDNEHADGDGGIHDDGDDDDDTEAATQRSTGASNDAAAEAPRPQADLVGVDSWAEVYVRNVVDFCVGVDMPAKLFVEIFPKLESRSNSIEWAETDTDTSLLRTSFVEYVILKKVETPTMLCCTVQCTDLSPSTQTHWLAVLLPQVACAAITSVPPEFLKTACLTLKAMDKANQAAAEGETSRLAQAEAAFLHLRPQNRANLSAMVKIFQEFEMIEVRDCCAHALSRDGCKY